MPAKKAESTRKSTTKPVATDGKAKKATDWSKYEAKLGKSWNKARTAKAGEGMNDIPDIPAGPYVAQLDKATVGDSKNLPRFQMTFIITEGEHKGVKLRRTDFLTGKDKDGDDNSVTRMEYLAKQVQGLGYETEDLQISELPRLAIDLSKEKPVVNINVARGESDTTGKEWMSIYVNKPVGVSK